MTRSPGAKKSGVDSRISRLITKTRSGRVLVVVVLVVVAVVEAPVVVGTAGNELPTTV